MIASLDGEGVKRRAGTRRRSDSGAGFRGTTYAQTTGETNGGPAVGREDYRHDWGAGLRRRIADGGSVAAEVERVADGVSVGFEIMEITDDGIKAWLSSELTQEEFDAIDLPAGWFKNQPREAVADGARFYGSPGADGVDVEAEHFGHEWFHSATVVGMGEQLDDEGLLTASTVEKDHEISFGPGATVTLLVSPDDERYVLVSRDADRTSDEPTIPAGWELVSELVPDGATYRLDGQTKVIRADNEDSFQGPVMEAAP